MLKRASCITATVLGLLAIPAHADHIEELVVTASHNKRTIEVATELVISPDVSQLLKKAPGANVNSNGPLTGIPQYRGMFGPRVATSLDGSQLAPSGPNWMDPPLSYAAGGQLESLELYRGIAPVSVAQESVGGAIDAKANHGSFSDEKNFSLAGRMIASTQSVNEGYHLNTAIYTSNQNHRVKAAAMTETGNDAKFPGGKIRPTEYERQRYDLGYGFRTGNHTVQLDYGYNDTGASGTPALPMDIKDIEGDLYNLNYTFDVPSKKLITLALFGSDLDHTMSNYHLRESPADKSRWRRNKASSNNLGFNFSTKFIDDEGDFTVGVDGFSAEHDSDIDNPTNGAFFVKNFNNAERDVFGVFLERTHSFHPQLTAELGFRYNHIRMNADTVDGTPASMMMSPGQQLRDAFNSADRKQTDDNFDLVAKTWYAATDNSSLYVGIAQKNRSPSYQERYLWLPLEATGGLADGYTYTGNINLRPEISRQIEFGLDYSDNRLTFSPRLFYSKVEDYIQGTPSELAPAVMFVRMMNNMNGTNNPDPLQFNNVDALLYGFDMDWAWQLSNHWTMSGLLNYVRGERDDSSDDDLYRIAPPNATFRLGYTSGKWSTEVESVLYAKQSNVSETNNEQKTSSYSIINLNTIWQATPQLQMAAGIDNLFDNEYEDHLGGYNRASNRDIAKGERLPGYGINVFARLTYDF